MFARRFALATLLTAVAVSAHAKDYKLGDLEIANPWSRATPATAPTAAGFLTITNKGAAPDRLIAVRASAANKAEIHEMKMDGAIMRMREAEKGLEIPPGATVELKPGGFHIMFMELKRPSPRTRRCRSPWSSRRPAASTSISPSPRWARRARR